jgi:hypothetical protein
VNDLLDTVDENEMKLYDPEFDWSTAVEVSDDDKAIFVNLDTLGIDHPTIGGRFNEEYPSAQESIDEYNNLLCDVDRDAALIVEESSDYIEECIESFNITNEEGGFIDSKEALNLVLSGEIIYRERTNEDHPDWWRMEDELKKQVDTCVTDDLQEFFNEKQQVKIKSSVVRDELNDVREYILEEYPVQPQN